MQARDYRLRRKTNSTTDECVQRRNRVCMNLSTADRRAATFGCPRMRHFDGARAAGNRRSFANIRFDNDSFKRKKIAMNGYRPTPMCNEMYKSVRRRN